MAGDPAMGGRLIIVSGPSGAGKGTLVREVLRRVPQLSVSVSATTRAPRPDESEGRHYFFLSGDEFQERIDSGGFLEWAEVHGNRYGTPAGPVEAELERGRSVILEIDVQGARQVMAKRPDTHLIFVTAPTVEDLRARMALRGGETEEEIGHRLVRAKEELALADQYEHVVVNDDVSRAANELETIIRRMISEG